MFSNIVFGRYIFKDSIIHKINPIIKLISLIFITIICLTNNAFENTLILLLIISIISFTKIDYKYFYKNIFGLRYLILSILFIDIIFNIDIVIILNSILKLVAVVLYSNVFMTTTTINELLYSLNKLLKPLKKIKIDINKLTIIITIAIKFIPLVTEQADNIFKSFKSRGLNFKNDKIKNIKIFLTTLFYSLLKKADDIANILEIRNFNINGIIKLNSYKIKYYDILFLISEFVIVIIIKGVI